MTLPAATEIEAMTPMLRQYYELKQRSGDAILFFRMGDFYEIFGSDAEEIAPVLELVLTSRERGDQQRIPFCGVPHHSVRNYWLKLLRRGYKVALADQMEDPAEAKGLVRRDIVRTLSPACIDDLEGLERDAPNYLMALNEDPVSKAWAVVLADLSTGELRLGALTQLTDVRGLVEQFRPKELLSRRFFHDELSKLLSAYMLDNKMLIEPLPESPLRDKQEQKSLFMEVFGKQDLQSQPCGDVAGGDALIAALLVHFRSMQASLSQFMSIRPLREANTMVLDETAVRDLELFETVRRRQADGSLFREINKTLSPMGARLLRYFIAHPLLDQAQIRGRHGAVRRLLALGEQALQDIRTELRHLPDLERLSTRIFAGTAGPAELAKTLIAFEKAQWILEQILGDRGEKLAEELFQTVATGLKFYKRPYKILSQALEPAPKQLGSGLGVFKSGYDKELDELSALSRSGESSIEAYQEELRARTGIASLKIRHHKSLGFLIEITKANLTKIPADFIRRQTMVNCERFTTIALQELGEGMATASERAVHREAVLYQELLGELARFRMDVKSVAHALASFDMIQGFAWQALKHNYCEPRISDDDRLELRGSRHPVVERYVGRHAFVPNDVLITPQKKHLLITGPNMAGKSTVMRQTAIAAILCQIGSFVPAQIARLPVFDRVFTRVGAADDLSRGQSTFMVEMAEASNILRSASQKSLVILDEVGRGTSTQDGLAIASAILKDLVTRVRCYSMFATHYHELVPLASSLASVRVMQTEVLEQGDNIVFSHRLKDGASGSSFGIEVARIAGLPDSVIRAASEFLRTHTEAQERGVKAESRSLQGASVKSLASSRQAVAEQEQELAERMSPRGAEAIERLTRLNLNRLTPLQALNILAEIQSVLSSPTQTVLFPEESC